MAPRHGPPLFDLLDRLQSTLEARYAIDREEEFMNGTTVYMSKRLRPRKVA